MMWPKWYRPPGKQDILPMDLLYVAAKQVGVSTKVLRGQTRSTRLFVARQAVATVLRNQGLSYPAIGRMLGRDHSTVIHAIKEAPIRKEYADDYAAILRAGGMVPG